MSDPIEQNKKNDAPNSPEDDNIHKDKAEESTLAMFIKENDIRVIIWGDVHNNPYSLPPYHFIADLRQHLNAIYLESAANNFSPENEYEIIQKHLNEHLTDDPQKTTFTVGVGKMMAEIDALNKVTAFGCQHHKFTRQTLTNGLQNLAKDDLALVVIGSSHLYKITDPEGEHYKLSASKKKNDNDKDTDLLVDEPDLVEVPKHDNIFFPVSSFGLVDYLAEILGFGILVIDGGWASSKATFNVDFTKEVWNDNFLKPILRRNQSVRALLERQRNNKNLYYAKNYKEWTIEYINFIANRQQLKMFEEYDESIVRFMTAAFQTNLYTKYFLNIDKFYNDFASVKLNEGARDASTLLFTSMEYIRK